MHAEVKSLHPSVQEALRGLGYGSKDISVEGRERVSPAVSGGDGFRGFCCLVDLNTGKHETAWGSWGGANMFNPKNAVDLDTNDYAIPAHGAVISGQRGGTGNKCYAHLYVHPAQLQNFLPAPAEELTDTEKRVLYCYACIKGGQYRRDELARVLKYPRQSVIDGLVDGLVGKGLLQRNAAGSTQITTQGKNASGNARYY